MDPFAHLTRYYSFCCCAKKILLKHAESFYTYFPHIIPFDSLFYCFIVIFAYIYHLCTLFDNVADHSFMINLTTSYGANWCVHISFQLQLLFCFDHIPCDCLTLNVNSAPCMWLQWEHLHMSKGKMSQANTLMWKLVSSLELLWLGFELVSCHILDWIEFGLFCIWLKGSSKYLQTSFDIHVLKRNDFAKYFWLLSIVYKLCIFRLLSRC